MGTVHYLDGRHNMLEQIDALYELVKSGHVTHLALAGIGLGKDEIFYYKCNLLKDAAGLSPLIGIAQANVQQLSASFLHHLSHAATETEAPTPTPPDVPPSDPTPDPGAPSIA